MASGNGSGGTLLALLAVLGLLAGGGAWNYQRNLAIEEAEAAVRPYRTLSDADLATLLAATEGESQRLNAQYERAREQRASTRIDGTHHEERLRGFERVQAHGRAVRAASYRASEIEGTLKELRAESERRAGQGDERDVFLRRLLTLP